MIYRVISCQERVLASTSMREAWCSQARKSLHFTRVMDAKFRASRSVMGLDILWQRERLDSQKTLEDEAKFQRGVEF